MLNGFNDYLLYLISHLICFIVFQYLFLSASQDNVCFMLYMLFMPFYAFSIFVCIRMLQQS